MQIRNLVTLYYNPRPCIFSTVLYIVDSSKNYTTLALRTANATINKIHEGHEEIIFHVFVAFNACFEINFL